MLGGSFVLPALLAPALSLAHGVIIHMVEPDLYTQLPNTDDLQMEVPTPPQTAIWRTTHPPLLSPLPTRLHSTQSQAWLDICHLTSQDEPYDGLVQHGRCKRAQLTLSSVWASLQVHLSVPLRPVRCALCEGVLRSAARELVPPILF